jgi:copper chaperone
MADTTTHHLTVQGMTCGHCVAAVEQELSALPGVTSVQVDLASGAVRVDATEPLGSELLVAAVDEAGYEVVGDPR